MNYKKTVKHINEMNMMANVVLDEEYKDDWTEVELQEQVKDIKEQVRYGRDMTAGMNTGGVSFAYIDGNIEITAYHDIAIIPWKGVKK